VKYWKANELLSVLQEARNHSVRNWLVVLLSYKHGLRASEVCRLTLKDVRHGRLDCKRLKGSLHTNRPLESDQNPLLDENAALAAWLRERGNDSSQFLFTSRLSSDARQKYAAARTADVPGRTKDRPVTGISRDTVGDIFEAAATAAGLEPGRRNPHTAKHTLGALAYRAGVDTFAIQQLLGHVDSKATQIYAGCTQDEAHEKAKSKMSCIFA
jgi:type 1 fimbriae regulatory protein FimB